MGLISRVSSRTYRFYRSNQNLSPNSKKQNFLQPVRKKKPKKQKKWTWNNSKKKNSGNKPSMNSSAPSSANATGGVPGLCTESSTKKWTQSKVSSGSPCKSWVPTLPATF